MTDLRLGLTIVLAAAASCGGQENVIGSGEGSNPSAFDDCPQFQPGTNMLAAEWAKDPDDNVKSAKIAQNVGDAAIASSDVISDLYDACYDVSVVLGKTPAEASDPPRIDDARDACADATSGLGALRNFTIPTPSVETTFARCDVESAYAACLESCTDGPTCDGFCASAAAWKADCAASHVAISFAEELPEELQPQWAAVEIGAGAILAVRARLLLANNLLLTLRYLVSGFVMDAQCVPPILESNADTTGEVKVAAEIVNAFMDTLDVD